MEANVLSEKVNNTIGRKEYVVEVSFKDATPTREQFRDVLVAKLGADPLLLVLKKVQQMAGTTKARLIAYVYDNREVMERVEPLYVLKRDKLDSESLEKAKEEENGGENAGEQPSQEEQKEGG